MTGGSNGVNAFLAGRYFFEPLVWWEQTPTPDFKKDLVMSIWSLKYTPEPTESDTEII